MRFAIDFDWIPAGRVVLGGDGKLEFPKLPATPGIYQLDFRSGDQTVLYVGETDNLKRRSSNYRNPGPTQRTSIRINARLIEHLKSGGTVEMVTTTTARIEIAGEWGPLDLESKAARVMVESAALLLAKKRAIPVENL